VRIVSGVVLGSDQQFGSESGHVDLCTTLGVILCFGWLVSSVSMLLLSTQTVIGGGDSNICTHW